MSEQQPTPLERAPLHVRDVPERDRYEATVGEDPALAALLEYREGDGWLMLLHTEVLDGYEGQGIGSRLVRSVFEDARARDLRIVPKCPFVVRWLERHPEQHDVLRRPLDSPAPTDPEPA
jgi:hypothetical protein